MPFRVPCAPPRLRRLVGAVVLLIAVLPLVIGLERALAADGPPDDAAVVERGHYLVQAANCVSCHTARGGQPFAGGRAFRTTYRFFGKIYSSNITPDPETGIGAWTEDDFVAAMHHGVAPGGKHLFPAFPYPSFTKLALDDVKAIYAYLKSVAPVHSTPPRNSFVFRQRWALAVWNAIFFKPGAFVPDPAQPAAWNRGAYLVAALGHCSACHTPRNLFLAEESRAHLAGGVEIDEVEAAKNRLWSAVNLTQAESGLARWSVDDLRKYLKTGNNRWAGPLGPMNEVVGNSLQYLSDDDIAAMATYIKSLAAKDESPRHELSTAARKAGQALYDKYCDECHLSSGRGGFRDAPPVAKSALVQARNPASLVNVILFGATPASGLPPSPIAWEDMPGFKNKMTDADVATLATFLRANWGNRAAPVSPGFVARQR